MCVSSAQDRDRGNIVRQYSVHLSTGTEEIRIPVPRSVYQEAREETTAIPDAVTAARNNDFLDDVVHRITDASSSPLEALHAVHSFVETIDYATDPESTGTTEYIRYPSETLVDGEGDCEDKAVLLVGLLSRPPFTYHTGLVFPPKHCATLVARSDLPARSLSTDPLTVTVDRTEFVYLESVAAVPVGHWAEDYGERPILASYTDFWNIHDMGALIASAEQALKGDSLPPLRAYT
ncbi:transglutaminase family protein [Natrinema versiforme]|uniref:transglutaminase-like domain-containing protein n=1 Tax=Natrinema versiforme TaxID=88724 RepID=UPI0015869828|nr:transglutaminase domain-containing protein [Natrinema versiforme]